MSEDQTNDEPLDVVAVAGFVILTGEGLTAPTALTPDAAIETGRKLLEVAAVALVQRIHIR